MRRAGRRDANEPEIVDAAWRCGFIVFKTSELGDLLVQRGTTRSEVWEVKGKLGRLTPAQKRNRERGLKARTVRTVDDVLQARKEWLK